jgi:hypothetical protein
VHEILHTGTPESHHEAPPEDPYWDRYIHGQFELARLSADEVGRRLRLPGGARSILDVGGGRGWYSAVLCQRHPGLRATVPDQPGSARVGRRIIVAAGLSDRAAHREGDALGADLGADDDAVLCFNLVHHLTPAQIVDPFTGVRTTLAPHGTIAVMDAFAPTSRRVPPAAAHLGMLALYQAESSRSRGR